MEIGGSLYRQLPDNEKHIVDSNPNVLESYHYLNDRTLRGIRKNGKKVFLDSGAFSAFTLGVEVDLPTYCKFIRDNADIIDVASVLDGIGDPLKTWQNQQAMEQHGTRPLPCFHYGEDERYLEWYISKYEYITLGGMVPISNNQLVFWLDRLWDKYLTDGSGRPRLKVHGFGLTSLPLMRRYPWYSVDSSSWVQISSIGSILLPEYGRTVAVSKESPSRHMEDQHISTMPEPQQRAIIEKVESTGISFERCVNTYLARRCFNMLAFRKMNDMVNAENSGKPFAAPQPELFAS